MLKYQVRHYSKYFIWIFYKYDLKLHHSIQNQLENTYVKMLIVLYSDYIIVDNELPNRIYQWSELDWLFYSNLLIIRNWFWRVSTIHKDEEVKCNARINCMCYIILLFFIHDGFSLTNLRGYPIMELLKKSNFFRKHLLFIYHDKRGGGMKLQELASVRSGLVLSRKQSKGSTDYRYPLINLRCVQQGGDIDLNEIDIYEAREPLKEEYLSQNVSSVLNTSQTEEQTEA